MKKRFIVISIISIFVLIGMIFIWWISNHEIIPTNETDNTIIGGADDSEQEIYQEWLITNYLNYFEIEDGFHIVDNFNISGTQFDFVIYDIQPIDENEWGFHLAIVVIKDGEVLDIIYNRDRWSENISVLEMDVDFDGKMDIVIFLGYDGAQGARTYNIYLQRDKGFLSAPILVSNPIFDIENQLVLTTWRNAAWSHSRFIYRFVGDEFVAVEHLLTEIVPSEEEGVSDQYLWHHTILVGDEWQVYESYTTTEGYGYHSNSYWREYWFGERWHQ